MIIKEKKIPVANTIIVSYDLEWTKNYKIKNGNKPFCFSFVYFDLSTSIKDLESLDFGFCSYYIEKNEEIPDLIKISDDILSDFLKKKCIILGHQISSDISVLVNHSPEITPKFQELKELWHKRKTETEYPVIFDTRYDLDRMLENKSRRLVDVCTELNLDVRQPELKGSMTKMHNDFIENGKTELMEKLSVLNIRHSLSAAILYLYYNLEAKEIPYLNINKVVKSNLSPYYDYINSDSFENLLIDINL